MSVNNFKEHDLSNIYNYKKVYEISINTSDLKILIENILEYANKENFNIDKETIQDLLTTAIKDITFEFGNDYIEYELFKAIYEDVDDFIESNLKNTLIWKKHLKSKKFNL